MPPFRPLTCMRLNAALAGRLQLSVLALFVLAIGPTAAKSIPDTEASNLSLEELLHVDVYSTSRYVQALSRSSSSASIVSAEEIKAYGYRNLADILRSLPGLYVTNDRNYSYLGSRGFGNVGDWNSRVLFLVDGYRVNENIYDGAYIGNDFILDTGLIDRVEYVAGPAAAMLYGNNAFFGVVNVITRKGKQMGGGELSAAAGSAETRNGRASYGNQLDNGLDFLFSASRFKSGGRDLEIPQFGGTATGLDHEFAKRFFAKFAYQDFGLEMAHAERIKGIPNASYGQVFNDPRSRTEDDQTFIDLKYNHALGADSALSGRWYFGRYDYAGTYVYDLAATLPPNIALNFDSAHGRWWGADFKYVSGNRAGHTLLLGLDYLRDLKRDQQNAYAGQPDLLDDKRHGQRWGIYAHDSIALDPAFTLDLGARYDKAATAKAETNPRLGLIWQARPGTALKALYGSAFRAPNVFELHYDIGDGFAPNATLKPERIKSCELVLDQELEADSHLGATLFRNDIRDLIAYVPQAGGGVRFENAHNALARGLELRHERILQNGGSLHASYTAQNTRGQNGATQENSPRHLFKLNWRQPLFETGLQSGLEFQYTGTRRSYAGTQVKATVLTNLTLSGMRLAKNLDLAATVNNLFDRRMSDPAAYFHAPLDRIPQDGREWHIQIDYRFAP